ncbi:MAG: hypothetical protein WC796_05240 [Candidatus Pacearchaeota archaeon]|jgi:uncharacterized membrane protein
MKESKTVAIVFIILLAIGVLSALYFVFFAGDFNFYKSEIKINGNNITETLFYHTDKEYHTLFRNFVTPIVINDAPYEHIKINSIVCQSGNPYVYTKDQGYFSFKNSVFSKEQSSTAYTELNEYGCSFDDYKGFSKNNDYTIKASYIINNKNLFEINEKYYIKFVAYSPDRHKLLIKDKTFFVSGDQVITKNYFLSNQYAIIYILYKGSDIQSFNIIKKSNFEFDNIYFSLIFVFLFALLPALLFLFIWIIFGRETTNEDLPRELSMYPNERKAWQVSTFFNPPLGQSGPNFFPTLIIDLYRRKIIDLKDKDKDMSIKILRPNDKSLDTVESKFLEILDKTTKLTKKSCVDSQGFINLKDVSKSLSFTSIWDLQKEYKELNKLTKEKSKEFVDNTGQIAIGISIVILFLLLTFVTPLFSSSSVSGWSILSLFSSILIISIVSVSSSVFIKFKKDYYVEYQKWQGFKHYLMAFSSMKTCPPQAIKLWEQHLVYATAIGVSAVVLKKFKDWKIIDQQQYNIYHTTAIYSNASFAGSGASGGGMGGAGGGGAGGGGGGGR